MKVLVACEESQRVCMAFRERGHNAFSCDIQKCSGGYPEYHIFGDVLDIINGNCMFHTESGSAYYIDGKWDMIIAHPPCTYLSNAGACHLYKKIDEKSYIDSERLTKGFSAKSFFMKIYNADCDKICVENPTPARIFQLPVCSQVIEPYMFGEPFTKRTCLWLKGLLPLFPSKEIPRNCCENTRSAAWFVKGGNDRQKNRSKTFQGIALAMAEQWG